MKRLTARATSARSRSRRLATACASTSTPTTKTGVTGVCPSRSRPARPSPCSSPCLFRSRESRPPPRRRSHLLTFRGDDLSSDEKEVDKGPLAFVLTKAITAWLQITMLVAIASFVGIVMGWK